MLKLFLKTRYPIQRSTNLKSVENYFFDIQNFLKRHENNNFTLNAGFLLRYVYHFVTDFHILLLSYNMAWILQVTIFIFYYRTFLLFIGQCLVILSKFANLLWSLALDKIYCFLLREDKILSVPYYKKKITFVKKIKT